VTIRDARRGEVQCDHKRLNNFFSLVLFRYINFYCFQLTFDFMR